MTDYLASHNISAQQINLDYQARVQAAQQQAAQAAQAADQEDQEDEEDSSSEDAAERKKRKRKEEEERLRKEEEERLRKEAEEKERKEAEERAKAEAEAAAQDEREEGEVEEPEQMTDVDEAAKEEAKDKVSDKAPLRIDTGLTHSEGKRRPGRLDLSSAKNAAIPAALPSALATARIIEDIGSVQYPEGVKSPKPELNVNAKQGKFRYGVFLILLLLRKADSATHQLRS